MVCCDLESVMDECMLIRYTYQSPCSMNYDELCNSYHSTICANVVGVLPTSLVCHSKNSPYKISAQVCEAIFNLTTTTRTSKNHTYINEQLVPYIKSSQKDEIGLISHFETVWILGSMDIYIYIYIHHQIWRYQVFRIQGQLRLLGFILVLFLRFVFRILTKHWKAVTDFTHKAIQHWIRQNELMYSSFLKKSGTLNVHQTYCRNIPNISKHGLQWWPKQLSYYNHSITDLHNTIYCFLSSNDPQLTEISKPTPKYGSHTSIRLSQWVYVERTVLLISCKATKTSNYQLTCVWTNSYTMCIYTNINMLYICFMSSHHLFNTMIIFPCSNVNQWRLPGTVEIGCLTQQHPTRFTAVLRLRFCDFWSTKCEEQLS